MKESPDKRWIQVDSLFREALERYPSERQSFLDKACAGDAVLMEEVRALLRMESESQDFLARPLEAVTELPWREVLAGTTGSSSDKTHGFREADRSGERIGPYRLVEKIGRGGMATVYLAERADGLWEQQVALKLVRKGLDTEDVIRRFLAERQILSTLNHPNIGRLLDGGTTDQGLPYLVMEYVEGKRITEYCDSRRLSINERLRLFCHVGRAVQHAHRSLVVHRDLKPSNILVTREGRVKLLDFGIAKILDPAGEDQPTRTGLRPLTPEYASPEQVAGGVITTASDVYQLGIVLCELLSGRRPYQAPRPVSSAALARVLAEVEPDRPSQLVTDAAAVARSSTRHRLARGLRGDLDAIVFQAIPQEPEERYPSAEALVADLDRYLSGQPISARAGTPLYRGKKLLRRQPWLLPSTAALLLVLTAFLFTTVRHAKQLEQARIRAELAAEQEEEVKNFLVSVFRTVDPFGPEDLSGQDLTVREALSLGADRAREELASRPEIQATLLAAIGDVYANLDLLDQARTVREETLELQRRTHGEESLPYAEALRKLGIVLGREERMDTAQVLLSRSLQLTGSLLGRSDTLVAAIQIDLGSLAGRRGDFDRAEGHLTRAVEILEEQDPPPASLLAAAYLELLDVLPRTGRMDEAQTAAREAVRLSHLAFGPEDPRTARALVQLADLQDWMDQGAEAVPMYREAIGILDRTLDPGHELALEARNNLAVTLRHLGDLSAAEKVHREILDIWRSKADDRERGLAGALQNLAVVLLERGDRTGAEQALLEARELYDSALPEDHYLRAFPRLTLAAVHLDRRQFREAETVAREAVGILETSLPDSSYVTATARCRVGRALAGQGKPSEARAILEPSVAILAEASSPSVRYEAECRRALGDLYQSLGLMDLARPHFTWLETHGESG